ncbi:MAG: glucose PTS transporter subunit IIA [Bacilli bacterium]|nr:glucose PTS transporter subunit IIA [Bacilli bacterium]
MDYKKCAQEILKAIGTDKNIISAAHCATRLRIVISDNSKVNKKQLEHIDGVKGMFVAAGQVQIVIGTGTVNKVYEEMAKIGHFEVKSTEDVKKDAMRKQNPFFRAIKTLGDIFVPIIPAIVACGILMGVLEGITKIPGWDPAWSDNVWYVLFHNISNAAFACLPILIAVSAAGVFRCNKLLAAVVGIILVHPGLTNAWDIPTLLDHAAGIGTTDPKVIADAAQTLARITLFQIGDWKVYLTGFQGHVIPIIMSIWLLSFCEKKLHKVVPEMIDLFVTPLVSVLITGATSFIIIGPIFSTAENAVLYACEWFISIPFGFGGLIIGGVYALTVIVGLHHMYNALEAGLISKSGFNPWMPIATCVNTAQGAAALAVAVKTKDKKLKAIGYSGALSAYLGITEPALFGINLRFKKPLIAGCIGGAIGGWFVALLGVKANAYGVTGIFGILITMFEVKNLLLYLAGIAIASGAAFAISFILYKDEKEVEPVLKIAYEKLNKNEVGNPMEGKVIPLKQVKDKTFSKGVLGKGLAVVPIMDKDGFGYVYAPFDGTLETLFETKHALGLSKDGIEVLIHVGINTVQLKGEGFTAYKKTGDQVKRGDLLVKVNLKLLQKKGYDITTPIIITNSGEFKKIGVLSKGTLNKEGKCLSCQA